MKHRVLIVGVGSIGERHARCFMAIGRAEVSIAEVNPDLRESVGNRYGIAHAYADYEDAMADGIDAAVIATPAHSHVPIALRLAEAGVHVLIEKPLSTSLDGIDRLEQIIRDKHLTAGVAYPHRANPILYALKQALDAGRFGRPLELVATAGQHFPHYRPTYRQTYYTRRETGGGAIQDALTHVLNAAEWLIGPIDTLVADAKHMALEGVDVEDTVHVLARHGQVMATYALNQHQAPNELTITVVCQRGTIRFELHQNRWLWMEKPGSSWNEEAFPPLERDAVFQRQAASFLDAFEQKTPALCSIEEGRQTLACNLAAIKSLDDASRFINVHTQGTPDGAAAHRWVQP